VADRANVTDSRKAGGQVTGVVAVIVNGHSIPSQFH
jgi:hypothetical protein